MAKMMSPARAAVFFITVLQLLLSFRSSSSRSNGDFHHGESCLAPHQKPRLLTTSTTHSAPSGPGFMMAAEAHPSPPRKCVNGTTEATRSFIESLFTAVALDNFGTSFAAALSDDLVWTVTGSSPIAGTYNGKQVYIDKVLTPLRDVLVTLPVPIVEHIFADGDWATVNWRSQGVVGKNGANYDMQYAWLMRTELDDTGARKIVEVIGFYDSVKVTAVFQGYVFNTTKA
ncbi:uncharacterized protein Z520_02022 [Fonsecaea multimorphosa CBS 102226]|uniref:SnoaL-like domain-containing protein n=1 Tax=Fonsecaea multimorphosa CBS 102226 TaxID=1442371 RepID=A0A0D2KYI9_9EURO|nr:uncharacterized protein Z520_02022 [Fonsecaea multimorphosa CBS 102226]KIY01884.1 hypothetical protein Z520_02022 [Fonsecaea multimorphosa CBS 102226]OAL29569.1 hypothetical protein AYO22_01983 [Fonsecaea multimorphosa]